jgi:hypothetical protein
MPPSSRYPQLLCVSTRFLVKAPLIAPVAPRASCLTTGKRAPSSSI